MKSSTDSKTLTAHTQSSQISEINAQAEYPQYTIEVLSIMGIANYKQIINVLLATYADVYLPGQLLNGSFQAESILFDWEGEICNRTRRLM